MFAAFASNLVPLLLRCPACSAPAQADTLPLCAICAEALRPAPPLCRHCADPRCPAAGAACLRPWRAAGAIESYASLYFAVGRGHRVLRSWKRARGPAFDRIVLISASGTLADLRAKGAICVVPVPQRAARAWRLGGSPAERVARWLAQGLGLPIARALLPPEAALRQASLSLEGRLSNRLDFALNPDQPLAPGASLLLVDDFLTTGRTLRAAAAALRKGGSGPVHAFSLGFRPLFGRKLG